MPAPRLTPAQKTFGIGLLPAFEFFRPPEGMEFDPAYSNFTRQQQELAAESQLQRQAFQQQRDELRRNQEVLAAEDDAIAAMKERPDEIPNILRSFPELARSRNLGGVLDYARAVTPSAAQKTLTPSIRKSLKPDEVAHFDRLIQENPDPVEAKLGAERMAAHETNLADMLSKGVPLSTIEQFRNRPLGPLERAAIVNEHTRKSDWSPEQKALLEGAMRDIDNNYAPAQGESALDVAMNKSKLKQQLIAAMLPKSTGQQPPTIATPAAEGGNVAPAPAVDDGTSRLKEIIGEKAYPTAEEKQQFFQKTLQSPDVDENFLSGFIADPSNDHKLKQEALDKFKAFVANPPPLPGATLGQNIARKEQLKKQLEKAEEDFQFGPELQKFSSAWQESKNDIDRVIGRFAKSIGASKEEVVNSLAANNGQGEELAVPRTAGNKWLPEMHPGKPVYRNIRDLLSEHWANELGVTGDMWRRKDERLEPFAKNRFADRLGVKPISLPGLPNLGEKLAIGQQVPRYKDVLDHYLAEKVKPVASASPAGRVAPKIEIGKPTPVK